MIGTRGTGKTTTIINELRRFFFNTQYTYINLCLSGIISANQTQRAIESKMEKRGRKYQYGPVKGKKGVVFIDDINMPQKDQFESQPSLELLRQWMDYGGWYDINPDDHNFKSIEGICFVGAISSNGHHELTNRYFRHYNILYLDQQNEETLKYMFGTLLNWKLSHASTSFEKEVLDLGNQLVEATIATYLAVLREHDLRPVTNKPHYIFNL